MSQVYQPVRCSMKECAYPLMMCRNCMCNEGTMGKNVLVLKNPKTMYRWVRNMATKQ